jgi:glutamate racemase
MKKKKKIACLHAHHSNIAYMQQALASNERELIHFVDPGLMTRLTSDDQFNVEDAQDKVIEQLEWIARTKVDAILITCTNYVALLDESRLKTAIPIIKIDEPFFRYLCDLTEKQILVFTNQATVDGTMKRLNDYADLHGKTLSPIEIHVIEQAFELIMQGDKEQYDLIVSDYLRRLLEAGRNQTISVAQLSMVDAVPWLIRLP